MTRHSAAGRPLYQDYVDELRGIVGTLGEDHFAARQLLELHAEAARRESPVILELGVDFGQSTRIFLNAIDGKPGAQLISVDIRDCANAAESSQWSFLQADSGDAENVVGLRPVLRQGIDILYVDSLHTAEHVLKEVGGFYPYLNKDAVIFLDDIDSFPYMRGQRKDNVGKEIANRAIDRLVERIFLSNINELELTVHRGSTGLARLDKRSPRGAAFTQPRTFPERHSKRLWTLIYRVFGLKTYKHHKAGAKSLLVDPAKFN
jgi:predicted O-methyltransferase YrrM